MKRALQIILGISTFGLLFSGVLTYHELLGVAAIGCPAPGAAGTVFGYPACVYGFFMYLTITATAVYGLTRGRTAGRQAPTVVPSSGPGMPLRP